MAMQAETLDVLEKSDVPPHQARAIARAIEIEIAANQHTLATRQDIKDVRVEMQGTKAELRVEMQAMKAELRVEMHATKTELSRERDAMKAALRGEKHALKTELRGEMQAMKAELLSEIHAFKSEVLVTLQKAISEQTRWMFAGFATLLMTMISYIFVNHLVT